MRDWLWGLAFPVFLVSTIGLGLVMAEWQWATTRLEFPWLWVPSAIGGGLVAMLFIVAGFIASPSTS